MLMYGHQHGANEAQEENFFYSFDDSLLGDVHRALVALLKSDKFPGVNPRQKVKLTRQLSEVERCCGMKHYPGKELGELRVLVQRIKVVGGA